MAKATQLTINGTGWHVFARCMRDREPFKTYGNLSSTKWVPSQYLPHTGEMPQHAVNLYRDSLKRADYIIHSYTTPIAWHDALTDGWVMPNIKYSVTTSKAQSRIAPGVEALNATLRAGIEFH